MFRSMEKVFGTYMLPVMILVIGIEASVKLNPEWYRLDKLMSFWAAIIICLVFILLLFAKKQVLKYVDNQRDQVKTDVLTELGNGSIDPKFKEIIGNMLEKDKDEHTQNMKNEFKLFIGESLDKIFDKEFQIHKDAVDGKMSLMERLIEQSERTLIMSLISKQQSSGEQSEIGPDAIVNMMKSNGRSNSVPEEVR